MIFLVHHAFLTMAGLLGGSLLFWGLNISLQNETLNKHIAEGFENKTFLVMMTLLLGVFLVWAYVLPKSYYTPGWYPSDVAVVGDNYCFATNIETHTNYYAGPCVLSMDLRKNN